MRMVGAVSVPDLVKGIGGPGVTRKLHAKALPISSRPLPPPHHARALNIKYFPRTSARRHRSTPDGDSCELVKIAAAKGVPTRRTNRCGSPPPYCSFTSEYSLPHPPIL